VKRAIRFLARTYPAPWRNRYQNEFNALLDDVPPTWRTLFDVFGGALEMQMRIWSPWKLVAGFAIAGVLVATAFAVTISNRYVSTSIMRIGDGGEADLATQIEKVESRSNLTQLINEEDLYKGERNRVPIEDVIQQMRQKDIRIARLTLRTGGLAPAISISFSAADPAMAQRTTQRLTSQFIEAKVGTLLDPASLPIHATSPKRPLIVGVGLVAGLLAGLLFALFRRLRALKLAATLGAAGAVLLGAASYLEPEQYSSTAVLGYRAEDAAKVGRAIDTITSSASLHGIAVKFGLYPNEPRAEQELKDHLHVRDVQSSRTIVIQFEYPDQRTVQRVTQNVIALLIKENWNFDIVDGASFPQRPYFPDRSMAAGAGLVLGLAIATIRGIRERPGRARLG
jgi:uncharacterized protein involved in exopolysaccharide biosynthesis